MGKTRMMRVSEDFYRMVNWESRNRKISLIQLTKQAVIPKINPASTAIYDFGVISAKAILREYNSKKRR